VSQIDIDSEGITSHDDLTDVSQDDHHNKSHAHDGADGSGTVSHANLTNVTADQHHAESHTLASHSSKAHSELTGVGADDHHDQVHGASDHDTTVLNPYLIPFEDVYAWATDFNFPIASLADFGLSSVLSGTGNISTPFANLGDSSMVVSSGATSGGYATLSCIRNDTTLRLKALSSDATYFKWQSSPTSGTLLQRMMLMGFGSTAINSTNYATAGANSFVGFRVDVTTTNTALIALTKDGAGASNETTTTCSVTEVLNTRHIFEIIATDTQVLFYIDGVLEATHTTNIPTATLVPFWSSRTKENVAKAIDVNWAKFSGPRF
jgi:hypothetical protein